MGKPPLPLPNTSAANPHAVASEAFEMPSFEDQANEILAKMGKPPLPKPRSAFTSDEEYQESMMTPEQIAFSEDLSAKAAQIFGPAAVDAMWSRDMQVHAAQPQPVINDNRVTTINLTVQNATDAPEAVANAISDELQMQGARFEIEPTMFMAGYK